MAEFKYVLIKNNTVDKCIIADDIFVQQYIKPNYDLVLKVDSKLFVGPGFTYDGRDFIQPPPVADPTPVPPVSYQDTLATLIAIKQSVEGHAIVTPADTKDAGTLPLLDQIITYLKTQVTQ